MGRTLALLRHAKSAYPAGVADHDRPLAERGQRDAVAAGPVLRTRISTPDLVIVSTAKRARQTWAEVVKAWPAPPHLVTNERIYEAWADDLLLLVRDTDESVRNLVLVGHNPGFEELAFSLAAEDSDDTAMVSMSQKYPTCGLAVFEVEQPWAHLVHRGARLTSFEAPRG
jgi:phosphohistidine phosphatase